MTIPFGNGTSRTVSGQKTVGLDVRCRQGTYHAALCHGGKATQPSQPYGSGMPVMANGSSCPTGDYPVESNMMKERVEKLRGGKCLTERIREIRLTTEDQKNLGKDLQQERERECVRAPSPLLRLRHLSTLLRPIRSRCFYGASLQLPASIPYLLYLARSCRIPTTPGPLVIGYMSGSCPRCSILGGGNRRLRSGS
ncbi:hypothetical protein BDV11DRAFT_40423 [Aspergillus similis]